MEQIATRHSTLPLQPTPLFGREDDVSTVGQLLQHVDVRLLTITGSGGIGKTRLALAVANTISDAFADGVWFVDLAPLNDPALVTVAICQTLGVLETGGTPTLESLCTHLQNKHLLLILDNFEHLLAAAPSLAHLLENCPRLNILATSREPLRLRWEHVFPLQPLALPDLCHLPGIPDLAVIPSITLFVARAHAIRPDFTLTPDNAAMVAAICTRLDGIALALELAASRISMLSPQALLARLDRSLPILRCPAPDLPARQHTLRATIDWSYNLLPHDEQTLFRRLSVFVGGWSLAAAEDVTALDPLSDQPDVLNGISALVDKGLVQVLEDVEGAPRFRMLETIREYATERLDASDEADMIRRRHMSWFVALAESATPHWSGPEQGAWLFRLERDGGNLRAALYWSVEHGEVVMEVRLCAALWQMWIRGYLSEGQHWMTGALTRVIAVPSSLRARLFNGAASIALLLGDYKHAEILYGQALMLRRSIGDVNGAAYALNNLGMVATEWGDLAHAATLLEESVSCFRALRNAHGTAFALNNLGRVLLYQGKDARATALLQESLTLWRSMGNTQGVAETLCDLGQVALRHREYTWAASLYQESLTLLQKLGNERRLMASCIEGLAAVSVAQGQTTQAVRLWGMAEVLRARIGAPLARIDHAAYEQAIAAAREQIGGSEFATLWEQGRATPLAEIVEVAKASIEKHPQTSTEARTSPTKNILSARESEVLQLVAAGLSNKEIGEQLCITAHTAKYHVTSILNKLGADTRAQAVAHALHYGLL